MFEIPDPEYTTQLYKNLIRQSNIIIFVSIRRLTAVYYTLVFLSFKCVFCEPVIDIAKAQLSNTRSNLVVRERVCQNHFRPLFCLYLHTHYWVLVKYNQFNSVKSRILNRIKIEITIYNGISNLIMLDSFICLLKNTVFLGT